MRRGKDRGMGRKGEQKEPLERSQEFKENHNLPKRNESFLSPI